MDLPPIRFRLSDFHDRSLSRGQKLSRRATEERGCKSFLILRRVCWPLSRGSCFSRTRLPFAVADQRVVLHRRLSLCFPASLETYQREHPELALLRPVGLTARPGRQRAEEILLVHRHALRSDAVRLDHLKIPLPAVDRHEVGHQLPCHRQRCAIRIAFLLFLGIEHGQLGAVTWRHLCCFYQRRLQMFVALLG